MHHKKPTRIAKHLVTGTEAVAEAPLLATAHKVGKSQNLWARSKFREVANLVTGDIDDKEDLSAKWRSSWDDDHLYVWVDVKDDKLVQDSPHTWADDSIEIYLDLDNSRRKKYDGNNDLKLSFRMKDKTVTIDGIKPSLHSRKIANNIGFVMTALPKGYRLEAAIPWEILKVKPRLNQHIGFEVQVNDDDTGKNRDGKIAWNAKVDKAWKNPKMFGGLVLKY